jgi:pilus assembly protein CpaF
MADEEDRMADNTKQSAVDYGLLQELFDDKQVSQIMVNGFDQVYIRSHGKLEKREVPFKDNDDVMRTIEGILAPLDAHADESRPIVQARLIDRSRVYIVIPPLALSGPTLTILKSSDTVLSVDDLVSFGSMTKEMKTFLQICIQAKLNILAAGNVGSGKTTVLNAMAEAIPTDERIITIEEVSEFRLPNHEHVVSLESRPPNAEGKGAIPMRDLIVGSRQMRPDRIIIGELHGPEVLDVLRLMNRGFDGTLTSVHADSPLDALEHLELLVKMYNPHLPVSYLRSLIGSAIDLIVQAFRLEDGRRKIVRITEVAVGTEGNYETHDVFAFQRDDFVTKEQVTGHSESYPITEILLRRIKERDPNLLPDLPPGLLPPTQENA